ncbi:MAG: sugar phosphate isomerase/epimerase [Balneolaceae bacterium]|nr:MAG: sugar phosphate isomerase/epimerase [Balneolaceae bacterium]
MMDRKTFLKVSGGFSGGLLVMSGLPFLSGCTKQNMNQEIKFGLQLYTLRAAMPDDPRGVLRQVAGFGYKQIESYEGPMGIYWGMGPAGFKQYLDDLGMEIIASHCNIHDNFEQKAADAASIGMKYLVCPWIGHQESIDAYKQQADLFNTCGEICRKEGIRFAYHNHAYTFETMDGVYPQDVLMEHTDPALVDYELDIYWVVTAGADPITWIRKYPDRFVLSHVKDRKRDEPLSNTDASVTLGTGMIDYPGIVGVAKAHGMRYFFVEQEQYEGTTPIDSVRDNAVYMKSLLVS